MTADSGVGATIGRYRLDGRLGRGGMGEVFRAFDTGRERSVALKLLLRELSVDDEFVARFRREARVAARLSDPHILPIHDFGEIDGRLFIDMRLVNGPDLASVLSHGPMAADRTAAIISQVASGLDAAHREGLVHRDVKPGNVLLAAQDPVFAYLTDFGVAAEQGRSEHLTSTGTVIGTVAYLAPEMFDGVQYGAASDIYALGCVLAEMLLGHRPFRTSSVAEAMHAHFSQPPPRPSQSRPDVPAAFDDIVGRAMAKEPRQRYATAGEMGAAVMAAVRAGIDSPGATAMMARPSSSATAAPPDTARSAAPDAPSGSGPVRTTVTGTRPARPFELLPPRTTRLALRPDYRRTTEPLRYPAVVPFLGNQQYVDLVRQRIRWSPGGSLLLAGLDGSGRTTVVARALDELHTELVSTEPEQTPLVVVWESVARPTAPGELIVRVLRGLAEALDRHGILPRLQDEVVEFVDLAHRRTTATLWGPQAAAGANPGGRKRGRSAEPAEPYGAAEAEYDFVRLVAALTTTAGGEDTPSRRWFRKDSTPGWTGRVVVVVDELDQLTRDPAGAAAFEELLRALQNSLTASSAHFVFVAGADVVDLARRSQGRGSSVWATVFGRPLYLGGLPPGAPAELLGGLVTGADGGFHPELPDYLEYRSRGLPRALLHELDRLVEWHPDGPSVVVDQATAPVVAFYASLERRLGPLWAQARPHGALPDPVDVDGRRQATYLVADWAIERRGTTFTASDLRADRAAGGPRRDLTSDDECLGLLRELATAGILDAREPDSPRTAAVGGAGPTETVYRLARPVADAVARVAPPPRELGRLAEGRYVLVEELGRSALGRTYRARDAVLRQDVVIRLVDLREQPDGVARECLRREAELAHGLAHPLLAETIATLEEGPRHGVVTDFVAGISLADLVARGPLRPPVAVDLTLGLVGLLRYLDDEDVVRLDLTPSRVVLTADGRPIVVGLPLAHLVDDDGPAGSGVVGTPLYLAPEALQAEPVDIRADLYSLGLILVEMLLGHPARGGSVAAILARAASHRPDLRGLPGSPELRELLTTLLDPDPDDRPDDPATLAAALEALPERDEE